MSASDPRDLSSWTRFLSSRPIPTLSSTVNALSGLKLKDEALLPIDIARVVLRDPLFALLVLRHLQEMKNKGRRADITTIEHALMMIGVEPFFTLFAKAPAIDELVFEPHAEEGVLRVAKRSYIASRLAQDWAARKMDMQSEEIQVAALLHDMAELLLWVHAPDKALQIARLMATTPSLRSSQAQTQVLGIPLSQAEEQLCKQWGFPALSLALLSDDGEAGPRVVCVRLAVRLARHSFYGFDNPALPDDWIDCCEFLGFSSPAEAEHKIAPTIRALAAQWDTFQR